MTENQLKRLQVDFETAAKESLTMEHIKGSVYAFGSEMACLRLAYQYRANGDSIKAAYSENRGSWFFRLELGLGKAD